MASMAPGFESGARAARLAALRELARLAPELVFESLKKLLAQRCSAFALEAQLCSSDARKLNSMTFPL
jgi:hypothetical protein